MYDGWKALIDKGDCNMALITKKQTAFYRNINKYTGKKHTSANTYDMQKIVITKITYYFLGIPIYSSESIK